MVDPKLIFDARRDPIDFTHDQKTALILIGTFLEAPSATNQFFLLAGSAGTGKTTIAENIVMFAKADILAPTNAAIQRLKDKFECSSIKENRFSTIHAKMYGKPNEKGEFIRASGLARNKNYLVDESSMIDKKMLDDLIKSAYESNSRLIFLGDYFQLEPVGEDPKLFEWHKKSPYFKEEWKYTMTEVMRNEGAILKAATHIRTVMKPEVLYVKDDSFRILPTFSTDLLEDIEKNKNFVILVPTNKLRVEYNRQIRNIKFQEDAVNPINDGEILLSVANVEFMNGEQYTIRHPKVIQTYAETINTGSKDYPSYGNYHFMLISHEVVGMVGQFKTLVCLNLDKPSLYSGMLMKNDTLYMDPLLTAQGRWKDRMWKNINIATYGYAQSTHKAQGNEWDNVYINCDWLSPAWNKARWLYTAITRARKKVEIKTSAEFKVIKE